MVFVLVDLRVGGKVCIVFRVAPVFGGTEFLFMKAGFAGSFGVLWVVGSLFGGFAFRDMFG
ncbi:hypothetical protein [Arthrobacter sp. ERGS1:01]|uniref:hypothetical protein n=1 Tax=Arthrobacter sp. ERGS1:01 TaxID=1704044 RepID=UPI0012379BA4|nr:hypothetical protein [Arthrobacter sp. ERGS1:01]